MEAANTVYADRQQGFVGDRTHVGLRAQGRVPGRRRIELAKMRRRREKYLPCYHWMYFTLYGNYNIHAWWRGLPNSSTHDAIKRGKGSGL